MQLPLQITFHGLTHSNALEAYVTKRAQKLDEIYGRIVNCRVAIDAAHRHKEGKKYRVRIALSIPGEELAISRDLGGSEIDAYAAIDQAFNEAKRLLHDHAAIRRGDVKCHERVRHGWVSKLFTYEGYGFIETDEGEHIYFHQNAVLNHAFGRMPIGARVRFVHEDGEDGTHATSVALLRGGGRRPRYIIGATLGGESVAPGAANG